MNNVNEDARKKESLVQFSVLSVRETLFDFVPIVACSIGFDRVVVAYCSSLLTSV